PWRLREAVPPARLFQGKLVIDAMNPYTTSGDVVELGEKTSTDEIARQRPGARVVKAFNTMYYKQLATRGRKDLPAADRPPLFVAGDDAEAKSTVSRLIEQIGFTPVDTGSLEEGGRRQQPGSDVYNKPMTAAEAR